MSKTRVVLTRMVAIGVALALALLLLAAREASAAKYSVAQCGWHVGADADWADTTGGVKFRPDAYCITPPTADPFDGAHLKSFTRDGQATVSGTRFARWRWVAPQGTAITRVSGTWWQTLHDGMQQRIGAATWNGGFNPFAVATSTDVTPRSFVAGFSPSMPAIEDRLLCARAESSWCSLEPGSWSAVRALTITLEDNTAPAAGIGGQLTEGGWRRGPQGISFWGSDVGGGVRFGETLLDGARVALAEYPCAKVLVGSEWRGTRMRPCETSASGSATLATASFSDGPHALGHCASDFAGNIACASPRTVLIDNNPPAHPRNLGVAGGEGWHRTNGFDLAWANPDQGAASHIAGASWRILGPAGYDSGVHFAPGRDLTSLKQLTVPAAGSYSAQVWLRDEAGNEAPSTAVSVALRLDDVGPGVAFANDAGSGFPATIMAEVSDGHSGPGSGTIYCRRLGSDQWAELPTKMEAGQEPGTATLVARVPGDLAPGIYVFRADASDVAGNTASTTRRADGTEMSLRKPAPAPASTKPGAAAKGRGKTRLFARLRWRGRRGPRVTLPFGARAMLSGRLVDADGAGLAERPLKIVSRPSRGAFAHMRSVTVRTGRHGGFHFLLPSGPSRRVTVSYAGDERLHGARRAALDLRVRGGVLLHASPHALRNGEAVSIAGRIRARGAAVPRRGKLVAIQYFESAARRWRPILVTRTNHSGRFHTRYRFRYVSGVARVQLRAISLAEERWPYAPGSSRPVIVTVTG